MFCLVAIYRQLQDVPSPRGPMLRAEHGTGAVPVLVAKDVQREARLEAGGQTQPSEQC